LQKALALANVYLADLQESLNLCQGSQTGDSAALAHTRGVHCAKGSNVAKMLHNKVLVDCQAIVRQQHSESVCCDDDSECTGVLVEQIIDGLKEMYMTASWLTLH